MVYPNRGRMQDRERLFHPDCSPLRRFLLLQGALTSGCHEVVGQGGDTIGKTTASGLVGIQHAEVERMRVPQPQSPVTMIAQLEAGDGVHQYVESFAVLHQPGQ